MTPISPVEQTLSDQFGGCVKITINKNESGSFRIQFHDQEHIRKILAKLGHVDEQLLVQ